MRHQGLWDLLVGATALLAASLAVGCGGGHPPQSAAEVAVVTIHSEKVTLTTELPGRTSPYLVAEIRPQVNGIIVKRPFQEGADVQKGALLYQIDPAPYQAAFDQAQAAYLVTMAALPSTRSRAERLRGLAEIHAVGQQDADDAQAALDQAEAAAKQARAAVETARINLEYTPIRAPISGRIGRSSVTVGALVGAYQVTPLAIVQQIDPIYVDVTQSSAEILRLRRALSAGLLKPSGDGSAAVSLFLEDGSPYPLRGRLEFREVTVDPSTASVTIRMVFPNPDHTLLPGMFVRAIVEEGIQEAAHMVPQQGVMRDPKGDPIAWVVDQADTVQQRALRLDRAIGDKWLVTKGLMDGDRLIVEGLQKVRPGDKVRPVPFAANPATVGDQNETPVPAGTK